MAEDIKHQTDSRSSIKDKEQSDIDTEKTSGQRNIFYNPEDLVSLTNPKNTNKTHSLSPNPEATNTTFLPKLYRPSKQFLLKCQTEQDILLDSIKESFYSDIKLLYEKEIYPDLFLYIGKDFRKALNKSIISVRAFKFTKLLREFAKPSPQRDIIVREFQANFIEENIKNSSDISESTGKETISDSLGVVECHLPEDLITPDLFLNFVRRVFTHEDISTDEADINKRLINWIKKNKPDAVKTPTKVHPSQIESFRTIQQDFEELSVEDKTSNETPTLALPVSSIVDSTDLAMDNYENQDDNQFSSLTRTETFELLTKSNPDSPSIVTSSKNSQISEDKTDQCELSNDETGSQSSYAPTTRTGLKPKTFTTPVGMRSSKNKQKTTTPKQVSSGSVLAKKTTRPKQTGLADSKQNTSVGKQSNFSSNSENKSDPAPMNSKNDNNTPRKTVITRAHPISMERSQSPATGVMKSSPRNFIAANKRNLSHMKDRQSSIKRQDQDDNEAEVSDTISVVRQLNSENALEQVDDFTLVSHSKLVEALSRLFIDGILSDIKINLKDDRFINAHKCILTARSPYFAEIISKSTEQDSTLETANEELELNLKEFSYPAVYFSIMHIYAGYVKVFDDVDIEELARLTNILHVQTLKQVCIHELKMNYCHFFHKPCNICCQGVLKALPLAWRYDYTDLYSRCLQWIGSHFSSVFCLKEFSELKPNDLIEECYSATLAQLTPDNIIPKTIECQKLLSNLPRVKWTESTICLVGRQLEDLCHYVAENYEKILQSESFLNLGKNCWECEILEENLLAAMNNLKPDTGCKTLIQLHKIECSIESNYEDPHNVSDSFSNLISKMRKYCERYLLKDAAAVVHCNSWRQMSPSLQKRIKDQAILSTDFDDPTKSLTSKPKLPSMSRTTLQNSPQVLNSTSPSGGGGRSPSNRSTPESRIKSPNTMYLPHPKNKAAAARHVKVLK